MPKQIDEQSLRRCRWKWPHGHAHFDHRVGTGGIGILGGNEFVFLLTGFGKRLRLATEELVATAGRGTVVDNLTYFAEAILDSPSAPLARELHRDDQLGSATGAADEAGVGPTGLVSVLGGYLVAEQHAGRVAGHVDTDAIAFLLAGALHNLLIAGPVWPRPNQRELKRNLAGIAAALAGRPTPMRAAT